MADVSDDGSTFKHLFSAASLRIGEDDWSQLVHTDLNLAVQVGLLLLKDNKELEILLNATEKQYEEERMRADHYEKQLKSLKLSFESQGKTYEMLERQIDELTKKYCEISEDCQKYQAKNKFLWQSVECLQNECELYLKEIATLKEQYINIRRRTKSADEATSSNFFAAETHSVCEVNIDYDEKTRYSEICSKCNNILERKSSQAFFQTECHQCIEHIDKIEKIAAENEALINKIKNLEERLAYISKEPIQPKPSPFPLDVFHTNNLNSDTLQNDNGNEVEQTSRKERLASISKTIDSISQISDSINQFSIKRERKTSFYELSDAELIHTTGIDHLPTVRHYHELFAQIFEKLKESRTPETS